MGIDHAWSPCIPPSHHSNPKPLALVAHCRHNCWSLYWRSRGPRLAHDQNANSFASHANVCCHVVVPKNLQTRNINEMLKEVLYQFPSLRQVVLGFGTQKWITQQIWPQASIQESHYSILHIEMVELEHLKFVPPFTQLYRPLKKDTPGLPEVKQRVEAYRICLDLAAFHLQQEMLSTVPVLGS